MSDFLLAAGVAVDVEDVTKRLRWTPQMQSWSGQIGSLTWIITRVDDDTHWGPAWDPISHTRVLVVGRFAFEEDEWQQAEKTPYEGGLAARLILSRWLDGGEQPIENLNGAGLALIIDEISGEVNLWTDRMGFCPAFAWQEHGFVICSHTDVAATVLEKAGYPCDFDAVTMAEFLHTGTATQPHTYWCGINQLDAATQYRYTYLESPRLQQQRKYWCPAYLDQPFLTDRNEIVQRLTAALTSAVSKRTLPRLGKVAVLLSAGADSRAALFAAHEPAELTCITFYDESNAEVEGARKLANAAGAAHVGYERGRDYYIDNASLAVRVSGGMWSVDSAHCAGFLSKIATEKFGTILTGCYADYLLKGITYNRKPKTLFGRNLPLYDFGPFDFFWHHLHIKLENNWNIFVEKRLKKRFADGIMENKNWRSLVEYQRLEPIVREPDASGRLMLRRCTGFDSFMSDNDVLDLFGQMTPSEKINGIPFGMAVSRITGNLGNKVLNNNYSAPVGATEWQRVIHFIKASALRKLKRQSSGQPFERNPASVATVGSWPHYPRIIKLSQKLRKWHSSQPPDQRNFLFDILGEERREWSIDEWAEQDATLFMRFYTASLWLDQQPQALSRVAPVRG